jgi:hypothetical protein
MDPAASQHSVNPEHEKRTGQLMDEASLRKQRIPIKSARASPA